MHRKSLFIKCVAPLFSIVGFFMASEMVCCLVGYNPTFERHGVDIPSWVRNAGTFERAVEQLALKANLLSRDVAAYQEDLRLFYKLRPNMDITVTFYDLSGMPLNGTFPDWSIVTDADGRRCGARASTALPTDDGADLTEIAFMGGSSFFGWGADYENTVAAVLEKMANETGNGKKFHFVNYAVPGYAMSQQLQILEKMVAEKQTPDYIVLDATSNCDVPSVLTDAIREKQRGTLAGRLRYYLGKLRLFKFMESVWLSAGGERPPAQLPVARIPLKDYDDYLQDFIALARAHHIRLVFAGLCASRQYLEKMGAVAEEMGVPHVNFYDLVSIYTDDSTSIPFLKNEKEQYHAIYSDDVIGQTPALYLLFPDRCHPNPTGHRVLAHELLQLLFDEEMRETL